MPSNTVGTNGWIRIEEGCARGFFDDEEAVEYIQEKRKETGLDFLGLNL